MLGDLVFAEALMLPPGEGRSVQTLVDARGHLHIHSRPLEGAWHPDQLRQADHTERMDAARQRHPALRRWAATGRQESLAELLPTLSAPLSQCDAFYAHFHSLGLQYGPHYRGLSEVRLGDGEAARHPAARPGPRGRPAAPAPAGRLFPVAAGSADLAAGVPRRSRLYLPVQIRELIFTPGGADVHRAELYAHARLTQADHLRVSGDLTSCWTRQGQVLVVVRGLSCQAIDASGPGLDALLYGYQWEPQPLHPERHTTPLPLPLPDAARLEAVRADLLGRMGADRAEFDRLSAALAGLYSREALQGREPLPESSLLNTVRTLAEQGPGEQTRAAELWRELWARFPAYGAELQLLHRAGTTLHQRLLSPEESQLTGMKGLLEHLQTDAPSSRVGQALLQEALRDVLAEQSGPLSVLIVNAAEGFPGAALGSLLTRPGLSITLAGADAEALERAATHFGGPTPTLLVTELPAEVRYDVIVGQNAGQAAELTQGLNPGGVLLLNQALRTASVDDVIA